MHDTIKSLILNHSPLLEDNKEEMLNILLKSFEKEHPEILSHKREVWEFLNQPFFTYFIIEFKHKILLAKLVMFLQAPEDIMTLVMLDGCNTTPDTFVPFMKTINFPMDNITMGYIAKHDFNYSTEYAIKNLNKENMIMCWFYYGRYNRAQELPCDKCINIDSFKFADNIIINMDENGLQRYMPVTPCEETEDHYKFAMRMMFFGGYRKDNKLWLLIIDMGLFITFTKFPFTKSRASIIEHVCKTDNVDFLIHGISDNFPYLSNEWERCVGRHNPVKCFKYLCEKKDISIHNTVHEAIYSDNAGILQIALDYGFEFPEPRGMSHVNSRYNCYTLLHKTTNREITDWHKYNCIRNKNAPLLKYMMDNTPSDPNDIIMCAIDNGDLNCLMEVVKRNKPTADNLTMTWRKRNDRMFAYLITLIDKLPLMTPDFFESKYPDKFIEACFRHNMPLTEEAHEAAQKNMPRKWLNEVYYVKFPKRKPLWKFW
jgi:hypothetical protein